MPSLTARHAAATQMHPEPALRHTQHDGHRRCGRHGLQHRPPGHAVASGGEEQHGGTEARRGRAGDDERVGAQVAARHRQVGAQRHHGAEHQLAGGQQHHRLPRCAGHHGGGDGHRHERRNDAAHPHRGERGAERVVDIALFAAHSLHKQQTRTSVGERCNGDRDGTDRAELAVADASERAGDQQEHADPRGELRDLGHERPARVAGDGPAFAHRSSTRW
jgi:hypothetical protein